MRIYLANAGSNSSHAAFSPLFDDGTFEFLPTDGSGHTDVPE